MSDDPEPSGHGFTEERKEAIRPEYILLDDDQPNPGTGSGRFEEISGVGRFKVPWAFRIFFILLALLCAAWFVISALIWAVSFAGYTISLHRAESLNFWVMRFWQGMRRAIVLCIGFVIAMISPPLGMGFIMLYCLLHEDQEALLAQMVRANYTKYSR